MRCDAGRPDEARHPADACSDRATIGRPRDFALGPGPLVLAEERCHESGGNRPQGRPADRAKQTFVSLKNTPEANAFILDFAQAKTNMDRRRAQYYEQALPLAQDKGDLTMVNRRWAKLQGSIWSDPLLQKWAK